MRFREFYRISEAKFNAGQVRRHGLESSTTLRRNVEGWDVWFKDEISDLPETTRKKRNILNALNDRKLNQDTIDYIRRTVKGALTHGNKLSLNKFQKAAVFRGGMVPNEALYSNDKYKTGVWKKFSKAVKNLDPDNLDPKIIDLAGQLANSLRSDFMGKNQQMAHRWFQRRLVRLLNEISGMELDPSIFDNLDSTPDRLYKYIHRKIEKAGLTPLDARSDYSFIKGVNEDIKEELLQSVRHVIDMFKTYHVQFNPNEVASMMDNVKKALHDSIIHIINNIGDQYDNNIGKYEFTDLLVRDVLPKIDEYLAQDVKDFVNNFVGNVRMSRRNVETDTTTDGLVYYLAYHAVAAIKNVMVGAIKAGADTDEGEFARWVEETAKNFTRVVRTLHSIGIRKFARIPVVFHYQDWSQRWSGVNVGGLHTLGDKRMKKQVSPMEPAAAQMIGGVKHEHYIDMYNNRISDIAHEVGHAVYYLLPQGQQEMVKNLANQGPSPTLYGSPDYVYYGSRSPSYAHRTGNEWFAEMVSLLVQRPELLNAPIRPGEGDFYPKGSNQPLNFPEKPHTFSLDRNKQVKNLNDAVRSFKQIFAAQNNALRGYKFDVTSSPRLPRRLRSTSPRPPSPQPPSSSSPTP